MGISYLLSKGVRAGKLMGYIRANNQSSANAIARAHYQRVIADGGVVDSYTNLVVAIQGLLNSYSTNNLSSCLAAVIDPAIFGYNYRIDATGTWCVKAYSLMGASSDVVQATESAQPLLNRWNSTDGNYFQTGKAAGDVLSSETTAAIQATINDYEIFFEINANTGGTTESIWRNGNGSQSINIIYTNGTKKITVQQLKGAVLESLIFNILTLSNKVFLRVTRNATTGNVTLYESSNGVSYTLINTLVGYTGSLDTPTSTVGCGYSVGSGCCCIYAVSVYNSIGGTLVYRMNAADYNISVNQTSWTDPILGTTLTVGRDTATIGYKAQLVFRTTIQGDAIDDSLTTGTLASKIPQPTSKYFVEEQLSWAANGYLASISAMSIFQTGATPNIQAFTGMGALNFAGEILNRIQFLTNVQDGVSSLVQLNNGAETTGTQGDVDINTINLLSDQAFRFGNFVLNTCIISRQNDNAAIRTAIYTLIRGWNDNPA